MAEIEVTIVTPLYNARRWLAALMRTVNSQSFQRFEHILVDDCSSDGSGEEARRLSSGDARIRVVTMATNSGPAAARNAAIQTARGRYLAFLDADDLWLPNKLEMQVGWMKQNGYAFTYHDYRHLSHDGTRVSAVVQGPDVLTHKTHHTHRGTGGCLSVMVDAHQLPWFRFPDLERSLPEDYLAWLAIIQAGHNGYRLPVDLGRYRLTSASRSADKLASARAVWHVYRRVEKLPALTAMSWWLQYAWNSRRLYKRAMPVDAPITENYGQSFEASERVLQSKTL